MHILHVIFFPPLTAHPIAGGSNGHLEYWAHSGLVKFLAQLLYRVATIVTALARPHSAPLTHTVKTQIVNRVNWSAPVICVA